MNTKPFTIVAVLALGIFLFIYLTSTGNGSSKEEYGPPPDVSLPLSPNGPPVNLSTLRGKVVLIDFWASWCGPCKMSMPEIETLYKKYRGKGLQVVGIATDDMSTQASVKPTAEALGITYPIISAYSVPGVEKFDVHNLPTMLVINREGKVALRQIGYSPKNDLDERIAEILKQ